MEFLIKPVNKNLRKLYARVLKKGWTIKECWLEEGPTLCVHITHPGDFPEVVRIYKNVTVRRSGGGIFDPSWDPLKRYQSVLSKKGV